MWDYSNKLMDLFHNPRNMGAIAAEECSDEEILAVGEIGSIACGDALRLHLRIDRNTDRILDSRFQTFGCASAIASSSALTEMIKGKTVDEALNVTNRDIAEYLDGLPEEKMHCSVMGQEALEAAIANYRGESLEVHEDDDTPLVCSCFGVSKGRIMRVILDNDLNTAEQVTNHLKAGGGCGSCLTAIDDIIFDLRRQQETGVQVATNLAIARTNQPEPPPSISPPLPPPPPTPSSSTLTTLQKIRLIEHVLEAEIRPALQSDGGDIELYDVDGDRVQVVFKGMCSTCSSITETLKFVVEAKLRDRVSSDLVVESSLAAML
jgi:NifU-like protein